MMLPETAEEQRGMCYLSMWSQIEYIRFFVEIIKKHSMCGHIARPNVSKNGGGGDGEKGAIMYATSTCASMRCAPTRKTWSR